LNLTSSATTIRVQILCMSELWLTSKQNRDKNPSQILGDANTLSDKTYPDLGNLAEAAS